MTSLPVTRSRSRRWLILPSQAVAVLRHFCLEFAIQSVVLINNPQQSWGFEWEPPKAVMKDSGTRDWTLWGGKLQLQLVRHLRVLDIGAGHLLVQADR